MMPILQTILYDDATFFITFTRYNWSPLIDKTNGYDMVYKCPSDQYPGEFDHLKSKGHTINGFVIMPNHLRAVIRWILRCY